MMRLFLIFTLLPLVSLAIPLSAWAGWTRDAKLAFQFLKSIEGDYSSKDCQLRIELSGSVDNLSGVVGNVLAVKTNGVEFYVPLDFGDAGELKESSKTWFRIQNGRRMFHYEYYDRNVDPGHSEREVFLFEAVKTDDLSRLEYVEFGLVGDGRRKINWMVCRLI